MAERGEAARGQARADTMPEARFMRKHSLRIPTSLRLRAEGSGSTEAIRGRALAGNPIVFGSDAADRIPLRAHEITKKQQGRLPGTVRSAHLSSARQSCKGQA